MVIERPVIEVAAWVRSTESRKVSLKKSGILFQLIVMELFMLLMKFKLLVILVGSFQVTDNRKLSQLFFLCSKIHIT
jgi:hypothetical protein